MTNEERAALTTSCGDGSCILRDGPVRGMQTNGGCQHLKERGPQLNALLHALGAEVVRLRALPVIASCGECGWCMAGPRPLTYWRDRDPESRDVEAPAEPPAWCTLRGSR